MYYTNVNGKIGSKSECPITNSLDDVFESDDNLDVGMIYKSGTWVEPDLTTQQIDEQLTELDNKSRRPMRAILTAAEGADTSADMAYLADLEAQAVELRAQRAELIDNETL